jgi:hypothetical protein
MPRREIVIDKNLTEDVVHSASARLETVETAIVATQLEYRVTT